MRSLAPSGLCHGAAPRRVPEARARGAAQPGAAPATIEVLKDGRWLFTYAEPKGTFATTDKPDSVPETARALVRVFDPSAPEKTPGGGRVYVTNLNEVLSKGRAPARPMSREAFETAALAAHPTGESSPLAAQTMRPVPMPAGRRRRRAPAAPTAGGPPVVTIYGTSWCGACRAARQYFASARFRSPTRTSNATPTRPASWPPRPPRWGFRPTVSRSSTCAAGCCSASTSARIETLLGEPT